MNAIDLCIVALRCERPAYGNTERGDVGRGCQRVQDDKGNRFPSIRVAMDWHGMGMERLLRLLADPNSGWRRLNDD